MPMPTTTEVEKLRVAARQALKSAREIAAAHERDAEAFEKRKLIEGTPAEQFLTKMSMQARSKSAVRDALGGPEREAQLKSLARSLELPRLLAGARFRPALDKNFHDSESRDRADLMNVMLRRESRELIASMTPDEVIEQFDEIRETLDFNSPADEKLALLHELTRRVDHDDFGNRETHARVQQSRLATMTALDERWKPRRDLVEMVTASAKDLHVAAAYEHAIGVSVESMPIPVRMDRQAQRAGQ